MKSSIAETGMVEVPADCSWCSYRSNGLGVACKLLVPHSLYLQLGSTKFERLKNYRELFNSHVDGELLFDIRYALTKGLVLGTEKFESEVEALTRKSVRPFRLGRPPKKTTVFLL